MTTTDIEAKTCEECLFFLKKKKENANDGGGGRKRQQETFGVSDFFIRPASKPASQQAQKKTSQSNRSQVNKHSQHGPFRA
jgi:hypothetical protein